MLQNLIVIAKHGDQYIDGCVKSLGSKYNILIVDTSQGGHPTGAYIHAFKNYPAENYLFIQDSMQATTDDPIAPFAALMPEMGAVGWGSFTYNYDSSDQEEWVKKQYDAKPDYGIFGPVFYSSRKSLRRLMQLDLLPLIPSNKLEAQGTERAWAAAFKEAGMEVNFIGQWDKTLMENGSYPVFRKVWGGRD